jgi:DNA-binding Xre family transcriptional regulator
VAKVVSKARQLRLAYQMKVGREVPLQEVSEATGIHRNVLSRIEANQTSRIDFDTLLKLCQFYGVTIGELLDIDPNGIMTPGFEATPLGV